MIGLRRRTVIEWYRAQSKFKAMFDIKKDQFSVRDVKNNIKLGAFTNWDDAIEFAFDFAHDKLNDEPDEFEIVGLALASAKLENDDLEDW